MADAKGITQALISIRGVMSPSVKKSVDKATKSMKGLKVACIASATAIAGGLTVATKKLLDLGSELDGAYDTIRIGTGATGKTLEGLKKDFEKVFASVPTSSENASQAIADLNTRLGLNGKTLQEVAKQAIYLSENLGAGELTAVVEKSSRAMQSWGIAEDKMTEKMDYLFKVSQSTGIGFTELAEKTQRYGATFQSLGYDFESASTMIGQLVKSGVDVDSTLAGMRASLGRLTAQGLSASEGFEEYYHKIKNATTETEAMSLASEIFGTKNGALMATAIRQGKLEIGALTKELVNSSESIEGASLDTMDFAEKMQILKNKMKVSLAPLGNSVFDSVNALMPLAEKAIGALTKTITKFGKKLPDVIPTITKVVNKIIDVFKKVYPVVKKTVKFIIDLVQKGITKLQPIFDKLKSIFMNLKDKVIEGTVKGFEKLKVAVGFVRDNFDKFSPILAGIIASFITYKTITTSIAVAQKTWATITKVVTVAQKALNAVLNANPIGIVCLAVGALVAGFIALYKNSEKFRNAIHKLGKSIKPIFEKFKTYIKDIVKSFAPVLKDMKKALSELGSKFAETFKAVAKAVKKVLAPAFKLIKTVIKPILNGVLNDLKLRFENIVNVIKNVAGFLTSIFNGDWQGAFEHLKNIVVAPIELIQSRFNNIVDTVQNCINAIGEKFPRLGAILQGVFNTITPIIDAIRGVFDGLINFVKNVFTGNWQGAWEGVKEIFSSIFNGLTGILKTPINAIIRIINKVINSINGVGFTIPDWVPIVGGKAFELNIPEIPTFAKGGIATTPSICGEGGYPEYVITTDPNYRQRNIGLLSQASEALSTKAERVDKGTVVKIEFAPVINCASGNGVDIMQALKSRMPEFVDMITRAIEAEREGAF